MQLRPWLLMFAVTLAAATFNLLSADDAAALAPDPLAQDSALGEGNEYTHDPIERLVSTDPQFAEIVDWKTLQTAIAEGDAAGMVDVALVLAEAERILLRNHVTGVTSEALLLRAARLAALNQDASTLSRLKIAAEKLAKPELTTALEAAASLQAPQRSLPATIELEKLSPAAAGIAATVEAAIAESAVTNDASYLASLEQSVVTCTDLPEDLRRILVDQLTAARSAVAGETTAIDDVLQSLSAVNRGTTSIRDKKILGGPTYGELAETFFATYVFGSLEYDAGVAKVGISPDNVICDKFDWDGNTGFWLTVRARYSGKVKVGAVSKSVGAERVYVYYTNGNVKVDLGGLKGVLNTKGIADWVKTKVLPKLKDASGPVNYLCQFYNASDKDMYVTVKQGGNVIIQYSKPMKPGERSRVYTIRLDPRVDSWPSLRAGIHPTINTDGQLNFDYPATTHLWTFTVASNKVKITRNPGR